MNFQNYCAFLLNHLIYLYDLNENELLIVQLYLILLYDYKCVG